MNGLGLTHEENRSLRLTHEGQEIARYVHKPWDPTLESPRPYFHPLRTLKGNEVSLYRPHDHVWHKGIAWSLPNVGPANFWGGPTYLREGGYRQLDNNGSTDHRAFDRIEVAPDLVSITEHLEWNTQQGARWFTEDRNIQVTATPAQEAWTLLFETAFTNVTRAPITFGSPTTEGRPDAGYGGLFWRGPRSFSGGRVRTATQEGTDELMGVRAPWLSFTGQHDATNDSSTLVFVDAPDNPGHPVKWFVRSNIFACVCPAPFFDQEVDIEPEQTLTYRYAVVIADGDPETSGCKDLADLGLSALEST